jgi:hypothetical protein
MVAPMMRNFTPRIAEGRRSIAVYRLELGRTLTFVAEWAFLGPPLEALSNVLLDQTELLLVDLRCIPSAVLDR